MHTWFCASLFSLLPHLTLPACVTAIFTTSAALPMATMSRCGASADAMAANDDSPSCVRLAATRDGKSSSSLATWQCTRVGPNNVPTQQREFGRVDTISNERSTQTHLVDAIAAHLLQKLDIAVCKIRRQVAPPRGGNGEAHLGEVVRVGS